MRIPPYFVKYAMITHPEWKWKAYANLTESTLKAINTSSDTSSKCPVLGPQTPMMLCVDKYYMVYSALLLQSEQMEFQ